MSKKKKEPTEEKEKVFSLFDWLNEIELVKRDWNMIPESDKKTYSQFMINRFISSKDKFIPIIEQLTTMKVSNDIHYKFLCYYVDSNRHYFDYKAYKNNRIIDDEGMYAIKKEYELGNRDAEMYMTQLADVVIEKLKQKWHLQYENDNKK